MAINISINLGRLSKSPLVDLGALPNIPGKLAHKKWFNPWVFGKLYFRFIGVGKAPSMRFTPKTSGNQKCFWGGGMPPDPTRHSAPVHTLYIRISSENLPTPLRLFRLDILYHDSNLTQLKSTKSTCMRMCNPSSPLNVDAPLRPATLPQVGMMLADNFNTCTETLSSRTSEFLIELGEGFQQQLDPWSYQRLQDSPIRTPTPNTGTNLDPLNRNHYNSLSS